MIKKPRISILTNLIDSFGKWKFVNLARFSANQERQKDSKWIYSSKYDEMQSMHKGRIFVTTDTGNDSHDVTIRMYKALMKDSTVVFSYNPHKTNMLLKALYNKDRLVDPQLHEQKQTEQQFEQSQIVPRQNSQSSLMKQQLSKQQQKSFQEVIQLGKYVDMEVDMQKIMKKNNDPSNKHLFQRQKQLKKYLRNRQFRTQLQNLKKQQGHPQVLPILEDLDDIKYFVDTGMDATYVLHQFQISKSNKLLTALQQLGLPYEILPCKNEIINTIVGSGFPADRFSIQYFPEDLEQILLRRKRSKLTIAIVVQKQSLHKTIQSISVIFGKQHLIFVENAPLPFRSQIHNFYDYLKQNPLKETQNVKIIVSPFIAEFNETLLQEQNKIRHIFGQAQSQKTNFIDLQILGDKLQKLKKKQQTHQIDIFNMTAQMIERIKNPILVKRSLQKMLGLSEQVVQRVYLEGQKRIKPDYLGIQQFQKFKNRK